MNNIAAFLLLEMVVLAKKGCLSIKIVIRIKRPEADRLEMVPLASQEILPTRTLLLSESHVHSLPGIGEGNTKKQAPALVVCHNGISRKLSLTEQTIPILVSIAGYVTSSVIHLECAFLTSFSHFHWSNYEALWPSVYVLIILDNIYNHYTEPQRCKWVVKYDFVVAWLDLFAYSGNVCKPVHKTLSSTYCHLSKPSNNNNYAS